MNGARGNGPGGGYLRLRPASSKPKGVLALLAASRVGAWAPPLPPRPPLASPPPSRPPAAPSP